MKILENVIEIWYGSVHVCENETETENETENEVE